MNDLNEAVALIALELHPDRIDAVCSSLTAKAGQDVVGVVRQCVGSGFSSQLLQKFAGAVATHPNVTGSDLAIMFRASSVAGALATKSSSIELVWTGPASGLVPVRHTVQVLMSLIEQARCNLFFVTFVAYDVPNIIGALQRAVLRGVKLNVLLEQSKEHGGTVTVDSLGKLRGKIPEAQFYIWDRDKGTEPELSASVHAKCVVADSSIAFITSANLSTAAMERNMEVGVLIKGGPVPRQLEDHLFSLIHTRHLKRIDA
jgi:cardiolipin synthase